MLCALWTSARLSLLSLFFCSSRARASCCAARVALSAHNAQPRLLQSEQSQARGQWEQAVHRALRVLAERGAAERPFEAAGRMGRAQRTLTLPTAHRTDPRAVSRAVASVRRTMVEERGWLRYRFGSVRGRHPLSALSAEGKRESCQARHTGLQRRALLVLPHPQPIDAHDRHAQLREARVARRAEVALVPDTHTASTAQHSTAQHSTRPVSRLVTAAAS